MPDLPKKIPKLTFLPHQKEAVDAMEKYLRESKGAITAALGVPGNLICRADEPPRNPAPLVIEPRTLA